MHSHLNTLYQYHLKSQIMNIVTHRQHAFQQVEKAGRNERTMADREVHVYQAKLAEQAERYDGKG